MKEAMWDVDGPEGMAFEDRRTRGAAPHGQLTLRAAAGFAEPELRGLVEQRL